jgi:hypothetical protein
VEQAQLGTVKASSLSLGMRLREASEEAGEERVESVHGQGPATSGRELAGVGPDEVAANWSGQLNIASAGMVVDTLVDEDAPGREMQGVAAHAALEAAGAHGALVAGGKWRRSCPYAGP